MESESAYFHGNLRQAALEAAQATVVQRGHHALSMRELAAQIGVVPSALYRHYRNRSDLLCALADQAHAALGVEFKRAIRDHDDPWAALVATGHAFLAFTAGNERLFSMMYDELVINAAESEDRLPTMAVNYRLLLQLTQQALPDLSQRDVTLRVLGMWSALFGYAKVRSLGIIKSQLTLNVPEAVVLDTMIATALGKPPAA